MRYGLCAVHLWQWEATALSDDYFESWWRREATRPGLVPQVLRADFKLHGCAVCGTTIYPWRSRVTGKWCTPSKYRRRVTCSGWCGRIHRTKGDSLPEGVSAGATG